MYIRLIMAPSTYISLSAKRQDHSSIIHLFSTAKMTTFLCSDKSKTSAGRRTILTTDEVQNQFT